MVDNDALSRPLAFADADTTMLTGGIPDASVIARVATFPDTVLVVTVAPAGKKAERMNDTNVDADVAVGKSPPFPLFTPVAEFIKTAGTCPVGSEPFVPSDTGRTSGM